MTTRIMAWLDPWAGRFALEAAAAATAILVLALLASWGLRRSAASLRHRVWALAILGMLAYPLVQPVLPKLSLGLRVSSMEKPVDVEPARTNAAWPTALVDDGTLPLRGRRPAGETTAGTGRSPEPFTAAESPIGDDPDARPAIAPMAAPLAALRWPSILAAVWAMGALIGLGVLGSAHLAAQRLARGAESPSDPSWIELTTALAAHCGVRRRVAIRVSRQVAVPMTAGWLRPAILLPSDCDRWPGPRRRMVLLHEMSHVARGDVLWQIAAKLACVVYWPHPLVWLADRRMRVEREAACDDAVVRDVERPSEYATLLLDVAASLAGRPTGIGTAVAMACGRSVEERIRSIVQPGRCRLPVSRRTTRWLSMGAILVVLAVSSLRIFASGPAPAAPEPTTAGQDSDQEPRQPAELATPGHVADSQGRPIANAQVKRRGATWTATTDARGRFPLPDLQTGETAYLSVSAKGFLPTLSELGVTNNGVEYVVSNGWPIELARPVTISGRVIGPDGKPLAGAPLSIDTWVHLRSARGVTGNYAETATDAEGRFTMTGIPPGSHVIYYPGEAPRKIPAKGIFGALPVTPTDGQRLAGLVLDLSKSTGSVEGRVFGPDGKPMSGAHVTASWLPPWKAVGGTGPNPTSPATDASGRYKLVGLASGGWRVYPSDPRYQRTQPSEIVTVAGTRTAHCDLRIVERYEPGNHVIQAALESERTNDLGRLERAFYSIGIQPADRWLTKFNKLPVVDLSDGAANQRMIDVKPLGLPANAPPQQMAAAAHLGELYLLAPDQLVTIGGTMVAPFTPPADRDRSYFGHMTRAQIAAQVEKHLRRSPPADGRRVTIRPAETYIVVRGDGRAYEMKVPGVGADGASLTFFYLGRLPWSRPAAAASVEKQATDRPPPIAPVRPATGPILRGRIVDESGNPLPDVHVVLYGGIATRFRGQETSTNAKGEYRFDPLETGARGSGELYTGVRFEHDRYVPTDGHSWRDIQVPTVDRHEHVLDLKMVRGGKISGIVVDAETGKPAAKLDLRIHDGFLGKKDSGDFLAYAATDSSGRFTSGPLFPGRYVIDINGSYAKIGTAVVRAGETAPVRLTTRERPDLQDPFRITGTATGEDGRSMVYGGVGVRIPAGGKLRTAGGGIDGRSLFSLQFGPIERTAPSPKTPYGVGTHDVEIFGSNNRLGYRLVKRTPSEPLRITDDPNQPELQDGIRYIRPNQPVAFQLIFAKEGARPR